MMTDQTTAGREENKNMTDRVVIERADLLLIHAAVEKVTRERDELREGFKEFERINDQQAETIRELRAEVEQLRSKLAVAINAATASDRRSLERKAEIERLRTALVEITELDLEGDASLVDAISIADEDIAPAAR
jgi:uncharacterized membrane protein YccC